MSRIATIGMRGAIAVAGGAAMVTGIVFAFQGDPAASTDVIQPAAVGVAGAPTTASETTRQPSNTPASAPTMQPEPAAPEPAAPAAVATSAPRPMTQAVAPAPTTVPAPVSDIPKYTDVAVLALAADVVLPSGRTFRECVELPPSHEKWPTPVHLYYEGKGKWLVETHVSEVQVVFDEVTATFHTRNFAPTSPDCR